MAVEAGTEGGAAGAEPVPAASDFDALRDGYAAGAGVPHGLAHSAGASRQWVSDELTRAARAEARRIRAQGEEWLRGLWKPTVLSLAGLVVALLLGQALTAIGAGWTAARTAGLVAAVILAGLLAAAAWVHRARGGLFAPLVGEDGRLSTSRTLAAAWALVTGYAVLFLALELAFKADAALDFSRAGGLNTVLAVVFGTAVAVRGGTAMLVRRRRLQKVRADRPRPADLLCDDAGRGSFTDTQFALVGAAVLVYAAVRLARRPEELPELPWALVILVGVSAGAYLAGKLSESGRPTILSVVRAREAGDLDAPLRTGDDIEIRGSGFVPPGATTADQLARTVVRIGSVHVHVPLVPVAGGFANPGDVVLVVPVPAEVEPGRVEVRVVTASGAESVAYTVDIVD
ncbi:hypothetical protein SRB5_65440 [Streptomyces sp. RB5]|uniref:Integral membrane protein n=1 Tax=Streptomyces smaragdinus TaxID=2585196 RepID=A0A7K0CS70_9ACTN|nr:hypothetical protein [Streptomyces smaragdinus]MQY16346.1 hypothetical protein [Streptomyces smaragdinus]